jgi:hypothetical protein
MCNGCPGQVQYYCVLWLATRKVVYLGDSADGAADALELGTCHGSGDSTLEAYARAYGIAERCQRKAGISK